MKKYNNPFFCYSKKLRDELTLAGFRYVSVGVCCSNPKRSTGGFRWYKASDINQPDKSKIFIDKTIQNDLTEVVANG